jgi:competence protein ComEA
MFAARRDAVDNEIRERFVRVVGLPEPPPSFGDSSSSGDPPLPAAGSRGVFGALDVSPSSADSPPAAGARGVFGALDPGRRGVRALVAIALVAVALAGFFAWRARPRVEPVAAGSSLARSSLAAEPSLPAGPSGPVVVAVSGRVQHPGLVRLPAGARVADAIEAAGGALPDTDLSSVNLARKLTDGELIAIGVPIVGAPGVAGVPGPAPGGGAGSGPLNLNTATEAQFEALPGIGPVLAQNIVDYRTRHGQFRSVDELKQVDGLGAARFAQLKPLVTV